MSRTEKSGRYTGARRLALEGFEKSRLAHPARSPGFRAVAFHGARGGVGASTLAAETVHALARRSRDVVAIDGDLERGTMHYRLDLPVRSGTFTIADVLGVWEDLAGDLPRNTISSCPCGAGLLPAPVRRLDGPAPGAGSAASLVECLGRRFDSVVVDTMPSSGDFTAGLLSACDLIVLVVTPELASLGGAKRAISLIDSLPGGGPAIELVVNRSMGRRDTMRHEDVESFLGMRAAARLPEDTVRCRRLADECRPLASERSPLAAAVLDLIDTITC